MGAPTPTGSCTRHRHADPTPAGRPRWHAPALVGAATLAGTAAVVAFDPRDGGTPLCWSQALLGLDCPLCGGLRGVNALARGDLLAAADHNVLLAVALPLAVAAWAWWMVRSLQDRPITPWRPPRWAVVSLVVLVTAFAVTRNFDGSPLLDFLSSTRSTA